ncbi:hypothetical protein LSH36_52g09072 [Paralvinella palmiformis]|uniref:Sperm microtubule inner protein 1 C-terminal domain-containing protein n=1 Tax=Paralvinella palmiformis TaxID=53620 RepID=A0AAD9K5I3_9ANNE|nr:hypothetical protein LSH36_52g09072 [Paralvinella palmiformis]
MPLLWKPARPVTGVEKEVDRSENLMGYLPICQLPPLAEAKDVMILNVKTVHYRTTNKNEAFSHLHTYTYQHTTTEMSRNYPANTQIQKFLEESYNKERDCRLGWYFKTQQSGSANTVSKQFDVFRKKIEAACPKPTEALLQVKSVKPKSYHKRIITYDDNLMKMAGQTRNASLTVDMMPASKPVRDKLYDGFTKEGKGRYQYLQNRYRDIPENKYQFPVLSSWEYGWRLGDVISKEDIKKPANARTRIVADTFYTRTGIPALQRTTTF